MIMLPLVPLVLLGLIPALSPVSWIPIAAAAVLTVVLVAAFIYALASVIGSEAAMAWSRFQIYEALLSMLLLIAFGSISYIFFLSPQAMYSSINIVPSKCTGAADLYALASCDVSQFNNATFALARYTFYATYITSTVSGMTEKVKIDPVYIDTGISLNFEVPPLFPSNMDKLMDYTYETYLLTLIFNQLQLIVLSASVFFLSLFVSLGLIARTFGFARTFGGAMIALGIGLGIIYPLLVSITYGYIDTAINVTCLQSLSCALPNVLLGAVQLIGQISSGPMFTSIGAAVGGFFSYIIYTIAGLTIIPVMNVVLVNVFISDFSKALGERISIEHLFTSII